MKYLIALLLLSSLLFAGEMPTIRPIDSAKVFGVKNAIAIQLDDKLSNEITKHRGLHFIIGDAERDVLTSDFSLIAWDGECRMKVYIPEYKGETKRFKGRLGSRAIFPMNDDSWSTVYPNRNGLEWDLWFIQKPATNRWSFNIETEGLKFYFQDSAWLADMTQGLYDLEMCNSYAVYGNNKNIIETYSEADTVTEYYMTGKVTHIRRPKAYDSYNDSVWCDIYIDQEIGRLTLTAPDSFIQYANYPIRIDPYFGKDTIGGGAGVPTEYQLTANQDSSAWPGYSINGVLDSFWIYNWMISGPYTSKGYVYKYNSTFADCDFVDSTEQYLQGSGSAGWTQLPFVVGTSLDEDTLMVAFQANGGASHRVYADAANWAEVKFVTDDDFNPPADFTGADSNSTAFSIYVKYSAAAEGQGQIIMMREDD